MDWTVGINMISRSIKFKIYQQDNVCMIHPLRVRNQKGGYTYTNSH